MVEMHPPLKARISPHRRNLAATRRIPYASPRLDSFNHNMLQSIFALKMPPEPSGARLVSALPVRNALRAGGRGRDIGAAAIDLRRQAPMGA